MKKWWLGWGFGLLLWLGACGRTSAPSADLIVATDPTFPPFESQVAGVPGQVEGFSIDLMRAVAQTAGLTVEFKSLPFDGIFAALQANSIDAAISSMSITPERAETLDFSRPYYRTGLAITVREQEQQIRSLADLKGKTIAVNIGTTGARLAQTIPGATVLTFDSGPQQFEELLNGKADAVLNDATITLFAMRTGNIKGVKILKNLLSQEYYGIALPKGSNRRTVINQALSKIIANGTYGRIYRHWFQESPPPLPEVAPTLR